MEVIAKENIRDTIREMISRIPAFDIIEEQYIRDTCNWIESGEEIFRIRKSDIPNKHLCAYFVLFDEKASKVLLVDHKKSQRWLPYGGYIEIGEHPREAVTRE